MQVVACSHPTCLNPILVSRPSIAFRAGVFLFRFLYFCPLEDDLDFDEEVEEEDERRR